MMLTFQECAMTDFEQELWQRNLEDFVPKRIVDAHVHIWDEQLAMPQTEESGLRIDADGKALHELYDAFFPKREIEFQYVATPLQNIRFDEEHRWFCRQLAESPGDCGALLVTPEMNADEIAGIVESNPRIVALKPYFCFASSDWDAGILEYLPESFVEVAEQYSLNIVLHLSRQLKCADEDNLKTLKYLVAKYPRVYWQLAHCACAFNGALLEHSVDVLRDLPNIFYDTSAVCDIYTFQLLLKKESSNRIVFGTDLIPGSAGRGKFHSFGLGWEFHPGGEFPWCYGGGIRLVYEEVLALKRACDILDFTGAESIFNGNHRLYLNRRFS